MECKRENTHSPKKQGPSSAKHGLSYYSSCHTSLAEKQEVSNGYDEPQSRTLRSNRKGRLERQEGWRQGPPRRKNGGNSLSCVLVLLGLPVRRGSDWGALNLVLSPLPLRFLTMWVRQMIQMSSTANACTAFGKLMLCYRVNVFDLFPPNANGESVTGSG